MRIAMFNKHNRSKKDPGRKTPFCSRPQPDTASRKFENCTAAAVIY
ncbi:hypothetical protein BVRB_027750 [Beta vulgaris subsp. vulgaris]|uniref:Uncharacterized protein n=1 Tax=Beta vulgaris subsp. vulgaris TaxID=3555 RepID=A0A0J8B1N4_BETVV|nr:hypothetical protein BVRB_027750 [Beta vulgaris subsp. vulgaris]